MKQLRTIPVGIYLFKVNNRNTGTRCKICSKLFDYSLKETLTLKPYTEATLFTLILRMFT